MTGLLSWPWAIDYPWRFLWFTSISTYPELLLLNLFHKGPGLVYSCKPLQLAFAVSLHFMWLRCTSLSGIEKNHSNSLLCGLWTKYIPYGGVYTPIFYLRTNSLFFYKFTYFSLIVYSVALTNFYSLMIQLVCATESLTPSTTVYPGKEYSPSVTGKWKSRSTQLSHPSAHLIEVNEVQLCRIPWSNHV